MTTSTIISKTPLSQAFFSPENTQRVQDEIRYTVWLKSNKEFVIGRQDDIQLGLIMRSIFLQYSKNLDFDLLGQIKELNRHVVEDCVEKVFVQVKQHESYLKMIETGPVPLEHSVFESRDQKVLQNTKIGFNDAEIPIGSLLQSDNLNMSGINGINGMNGMNGFN